MSLRPIPRVLAALTVCTAWAFLTAHTFTQQEPAPGLIRMNVELVNLLSTVRDRSGAYVSNLAQDDFTVLEDGRRQPITRFARQTDQPLTVALLFDVSYKMHARLDAETDDARQFFRNILRQDDSALLAGFAATVGMWQPVTSSRQELEQALNQVPQVGERLSKGLPTDKIIVTPREVLPHGVTFNIRRPGAKLYDAVALVSAKYLRELPGRKAIIALTGGLDDGSQNSRNDAVRSMLAADTLFFGIHCADDMGEGMSDLKALSSQTGGNTFHVDKNVTLDMILHAIEEQLRNQYAIGYAPPDNSKTGTFHKVEVKVNKPGLTVLVRQSYFR